MFATSSLVNKDVYIKLESLSYQRVKIILVIIVCVVLTNCLQHVTDYTIHGHLH